MTDCKYLDPTRRWVETLVVDLNLCPFAKRELVNDRVRFQLSPAQSEAELLQDLQNELLLLGQDDDIETTLLVHPQVLQDFFDYNQFLDYAEALLQELELEGVFQIASFHPNYQFAGTHHDDAENYTNRSPYPTLHLIREASLEQAVANHPDPDGIPERNIELMNEMGTDKMRALLANCFNHS